jgi:hypothetical protein
MIRDNGRSSQVPLLPLRRHDAGAVHAAMRRALQGHEAEGAG